MSGTRKVAAILAADVVGYSRLAGGDEDDTLARLRALRREHVDPSVATCHGRVFKGTGDGLLGAFRSVLVRDRLDAEVVDLGSAVPAARPFTTPACPSSRPGACEAGLPA